MPKMAQRWYVKWPHQTYAWGPVTYHVPLSERQFRADVRISNNLKRLPRGWQCWPA